MTPAPFISVSTHKILKHTFNGEPQWCFEVIANCPDEDIIHHVFIYLFYASTIAGNREANELMD